MNKEIEYKASGLVFDIQRASVNNGPGVRTTVFLKGCPLNCSWCHNPEAKSFSPQCKPVLEKTVSELERELQSDVNNKAIQVNKNYEISSREKGKRLNTEFLNNSSSCVIGQYMKVEKIIDIVTKDTQYFKKGNGGLTISGGEPFAQPVFTLNLLRAAKEAGINTCVDTSGFCTEKALLESLPYVDTFLFDFKVGLDKKHIKYTGRSNKRILDNLALLGEKGADIVLRCPIIPSINNCYKHLDDIKKIYEENPGIKAVELMPYENYWLGKYPELINDSAMKKVEPLSIEELASLEEELTNMGVKLYSDGED